MGLIGRLGLSGQSGCIFERCVLVVLSDRLVYHPEAGRIRYYLNG